MLFIIYLIGKFTYFDTLTSKTYLYTLQNSDGYLWVQIGADSWCSILYRVMFDMDLFIKCVSIKRCYLFWFFSLNLLTSCTTYACEHDWDCNNHQHNEEKCCHGSCIDKDSSCISGAAIAGIVIGCLILGGIIISCCLCFCCSCGPFQSRNQETVIRYGGQATTTTGISSYPTPSMQRANGVSLPQLASIWLATAERYPKCASRYSK